MLPLPLPGTFELHSQTALRGLTPKFVFVCVRACVCACVRACVCMCVRVCVRACV